MWRFLRMSVMLAAIGIVLTACTATTDTSPMTDEELERTIVAKLDSDPDVMAANLEVSADAERNEATVSGLVESEALRTRAVELVKTAREGLVVVDKIDVEPPDPAEVSRDNFTEEMGRTVRDNAARFGEKIGDSLDDSWIHAKVVAQLIGDPDTPQRKINVDVVDNVVTLRGTVDSKDQKAEAELIAKNTEGVKSVRNQLKVAPRTGS